MKEFAKENPSNVSLIFDSKKEPINYSWCHYAKYPEMKKYLINEKNDNGYSLRDVRTNKVVMSSSFSLERFLK